MRTYELSLVMLGLYMGVAWVAGHSGALEAAYKAVVGAF